MLQTSIILKVIISGSLKMPFYAVRRGRIPGVYFSWPECSEQVNAFTGAKYKKFNTENDAWAFINEPDSPTMHKTASPKTPRTRTRTPSLAPQAAPVALPTGHVAAIAQPPNIIAQPPAATSGRATVSSTRLLALKGTIQNITQSVAQIQQFCAQAQQQLEQIGSKRRAPDANADEPPPVSRRRVDNVGTDTSHTPNIDGLSVSDDGYVNVYTDGCCHNNGQVGATAGIGVYWGPNHQFNISERLQGKPTNNRAEIHAACAAARHAKEQGITKLRIHTDSQFTINGISKWIHKWKRNGWKLSGGGDVINKDDFLELDDAVSGLNVQWVHVRGHMGDVGNEAADSLANDGARKPSY